MSYPEFIKCFSTGHSHTKYNTGCTKMQNKNQNPAEIIKLTRELVERYCEINKANFVEGCKRLLNEVNQCINTYLKKKYEHQDIILFKKYMVQFRFRKGYLKEEEQILQKLLKRLSILDENTELMIEYIKNHNFIGFSNLIHRFVPDLSGIEITLPYEMIVHQLSYELEVFFKRKSCFKIIKISNYMEEPQETGYRAIHFQLLETIFPYELQLKTYFQAAWARFTHDLVYKKQDTITPSIAINRRFKNLADLLSVCDKIAEEIFNTYIEERYERKRKIGG